MQTNTQRFIDCDFVGLQRPKRSKLKFPDFIENEKSSVAPIDWMGKLLDNYLKKHLVESDEDKNVFIPLQGDTVTSEQSFPIFFS